MADKRTEKNSPSEGEATGVSRWRRESGAARGAGSGKGGAGRGADGRARRRRGLSALARRQVAALVVALLLAVGCVVAALPPQERLGWGSDFSGGTAYTYTTDESADTSAIASTLRSRLATLGVEGARVSSGDGTLTVTVPAGQDASSAVSEAVKVGRLELARLDSVSDADAVARIQAGASDVALEEGTYTPILDGTNVSSAAAVATSATSGTYGIQLSLDPAGTEAFAQATSELAPVSGQILVILDGTVVAAPSVSSAIEDGRVAISLGLSADEANGIVAATQTGALPSELADGGSSDFAAPVDSARLLRAGVVAGAVVLVVLVALLAWMRLLGLVAYAALVATAVFEVGGIALFSLSGLFVPTVTAYLSAAVAVAVAFVEQVRALVRLRSRVRGGTDPRDAVASLVRSLREELLALSAVLVVGGLVLYFLVGDAGLSTGPSGLVWVVAPVAGALSLGLVVMPLARLAAMGPMRSHPGSWGVARRAGKDKD